MTELFINIIENNGNKITAVYGFDSIITENYTLKDLAKDFLDELNVEPAIIPSEVLLLIPEIINSKKLKEKILSFNDDFKEKLENFEFIVSSNTSDPTQPHYGKTIIHNTNNFIDIIGEELSHYFFNYNTYKSCSKLLLKGKFSNSAIEYAFDNICALQNM